MASYLITGPDGSKYKVSGPDGASPEAALQQFFTASGNAPAAPTPQAIPQGDWNALKGRLDQAETRVKDSGPYRPEDVKAYREAQAKKEGELYGRQYGAGESTGGIIGGFAASTAGMGLPRYMEALTNPTLPTAQAHEFLKGADDGRAEVRSGAALAGKGLGILGQVAALPTAGGATLGARALSAAGQAGTVGAVESGVESRGDIGKILTGGGVGALTGGVASAGTEKLIQAGRAVIDPLRGLAKSGPADVQANARILLAAKKMGIDDATAQRKLAELGPDGFVADILGPHGSRLARNAANYSPEAESLLAGAAAERVGGQPQRMAAALYDAASGLPIGKTMQGPLPRPSAGSPDALKEAIYEAAQPAVRAGYKAAEQQGFAQPLKHPEWMNNSPMIQEALDYAQKNTMNRVALHGPDAGSQFSLLDDARQFLAKKGFMEGNNDAKGLARKLNAYIDENIPVAADARGLAQTYKQRQEAIDFGSAAAKPRVTSENAQNLGNTKYPGDAGQAFALQKIEEILNRKPGQNALDIVNGTTANKGALLQALGGRAGDVQRQIAAERQFVKFKNDISGNSKTAQYLLDAGVFGGTAGGSALAGFDPSQAGTIGGIATLGRRGAGKLVEALAKKNEAAVSPEMAKALLARSLPKLQDANGKQITETARRRLVEALMKDTARGGSLTYSQSR